MVKKKNNPGLKVVPTDGTPSYLSKLHKYQEINTPRHLKALKWAIKIIFLLAILDIALGTYN